MRYPLRQSQVDALENLYAGIPSANCKGLCVSQCTVVLMTRLEYRRICNALDVKDVREDNTIDCPLLKGGRCSLYNLRPVVCRIYGVAEGLPCPHGCVPDAHLSDDDAHSVLDTAKALSGDGKGEYYTLHDTMFLMSLGKKREQ